jgi:hypothetical protein
MEKSNRKKVKHKKSIICFWRVMPLAMGITEIRPALALPHARPYLDNAHGLEHYYPTHSTHLKHPFCSTFSLPL